MLDSSARRYLRGRAHHLEPVVQIGKDGVTDAVIQEIERTAAQVELLKIRVRPNAPLGAKETAVELGARLGGEIVGAVGRVIVYFLPGKEDTAFPEINR
jgi:RNA-binding protein